MIESAQERANRKAAEARIEQMRLREKESRRRYGSEQDRRFAEGRDGRRDYEAENDARRLGTVKGLGYAVRTNQPTVSEYVDKMAQTRSAEEARLEEFERACREQRRKELGE